MAPYSVRGGDINVMQDDDYGKIGDHHRENYDPLVRLRPSVGLSRFDERYSLGEPALPRVAVHSLAEKEAGTVRDRGRPRTDALVRLRAQRRLPAAAQGRVESAAAFAPPSTRI